MLPTPLHRILRGRRVNSSQNLPLSIAPDLVFQFFAWWLILLNSCMLRLFHFVFQEYSIFETKLGKK